MNLLSGARLHTCVGNQQLRAHLQAHARTAPCDGDIGTTRTHESIQVHTVYARQPRPVPPSSRGKQHGLADVYVRSWYVQ